MSGRQGGNNFASDYNDVASRIVEFREKYPNGSLQPADPSEPFKVLTLGDKTFLVVVAAAYRSPDDPRPGIGQAMEQFPGQTNFTRNSELQNAETSAWGRAIMAALAADAKKGIATAEEVRNRREEQATRTVQSVPAQQSPADRLRDEILAAATAAGLSPADVLREWADAHGGEDIRSATDVGGLELLRDDLRARQAVAL